MRVLAVESASDPASVAIAGALESEAQWEPTGWVVEENVVHALVPRPEILLLRTPRLHLEAEPLEEAAKSVGVPFDAIVFLSRHRAASGRPALTVHPVGNFGEAKYGGKAGQVSPSAAALQSELLRALRRHVDAGEYPAEVTFEATHHGPLLSTPSCFLELGSSEAQWGDPAGARVVARAFLDVARGNLPDSPIIVGVGGGHYAPRFTETVLERAVHVGHMMPEHAAALVADPTAMMRQMIERTPGAQGVYLHRKGLGGGQNQRWKEAAETAGIPLASSDAWAELAQAPPR